MWLNLNLKLPAYAGNIRLSLNSTAKSAKPQSQNCR